MFHRTSSTKLFNHILEQSWDEASFRVQKRPREARRWTEVKFDKDRATEMLPLHKACTYAPPLQFIDALLSLYPDGVRQHDSFFHRLPLHFAVMRGASLNVVRTLVHSYRKGTHIPDRYGRLPLHYAVYSGAQTEIVLTLLCANPEAARVQDRSGWLPLHVGIRHRSTDAVIEALIKAFPKAVEIKTENGMTPLMVSRKFGVCTEPSKQVLLQQKERDEKRRYKNSSDAFSSLSNSKGAVAA